MKRTLNLLAVVICVAAILCSCENGKKENNRNDQPGGKQVRTYFSTIDDFNKFITTGSEKPEDYSSPPVPDIPKRQGTRGTDPFSVFGLFVCIIRILRRILRFTVL